MGRLCPIVGRDWSRWCFLWHCYFGSKVPTVVPIVSPSSREILFWEICRQVFPFQSTWLTLETVNETSFASVHSYIPALVLCETVSTSMVVTATRRRCFLVSGIAVDMLASRYIMPISPRSAFWFSQSISCGSSLPPSAKVLGLVGHQFHQKFRKLLGTNANKWERKNAYAFFSLI